MDREHSLSFAFSSSFSPLLAPSTVPIVHRETFLEWFLDEDFFPKSFERTDAREHGGITYVIGRDEVYRYDPTQEGGQISLRAHWAAVREEAEILHDLAPGLFIGVRAFRWEQGVPLWLTEEPILPTSSGFPVGTDGFCIVMRRLFQARSFSELAVSDELQGVLPVARRLRRRHTLLVERRGREGIHFGRSGISQYFLPSKKEVGQITKLIENRPLAGLIALQLLSYLKSFPLEQNQTFRQYCSLVSSPVPSMADLVFGKVREGIPCGMIVPKISPGAKRRVQHPLDDLATCSVTLTNSFSEDQQIRRRFERSYRVSETLWNDPALYNFFFIRAALMQGLEHLSKTSEGLAGLEQSVGERLLERGLQKLYGLERKFVLLLDEGNEHLAEIVASITGAELPPADTELRMGVRERQHYLPQLESELLGEHLRITVERILSSERSCIVCTSQRSRIDLLRSIAERHGASVCILSNTAISVDFIPFQSLLSEAENAISAVNLLGQSLQSSVIPGQLTGSP